MPFQLSFWCDETEKFWGDGLIRSKNILWFNRRSGLSGRRLECSFFAGTLLAELAIPAGRLRGDVSEIPITLSVFECKARTVSVGR